MSGFPPRSPIAGRQQLDERRERSMSAIYATVFAVVFAHAICLPSISSYLAGFHSESIMLGYCISAVCLGELCSTPLFSKWYEIAPARDLAMVSLAISTVGSVLYAVATNDVFVLASRFLVGVAAGVQGPFLSMAAGLCADHERYDTVVAVRSMHTVAFVLATGVAAVATFVHTPAPVSPLNHMEHMMPQYVREMHLPNSSYSDSLGTLGDMVIPPDSYSKMGSQIWHAAAAKASAMGAYGSEAAVSVPKQHAARGPRRMQGDGAHARKLLGADEQVMSGMWGRDLKPSWLPPRAASAAAVSGEVLPHASTRSEGGRAPTKLRQRLQSLLRHQHGAVERRSRMGVGTGMGTEQAKSGSMWELTKAGFRGDSWHKLVPSSSDLRKMVPNSDEVTDKMHGAISRLNREATEVGKDAMQVGSLTQHDLGMAGIHAGSDSGEGQEGLKTEIAWSCQDSGRIRSRPHKLNSATVQNVHMRTDLITLVNIIIRGEMARMKYAGDLI